MQDKHLFEYAVIRVVPRVEREEFLNVGVILYCPDRKYLHTLFHLDEKRLSHCCNGIDFAELQRNLESLEKICEGGSHAGPIGTLDVASRFRWLTATRSTIVQSSKVHIGFCTDPGETLQRLFEQLVL
jgi:hypothetical protein